MTSNRMTEADFDRERATLRETYGDSRKEAGARFEQELGKLFYRSGWTQEQLAKKEGKSPALINYQLRFGRFLEFITTGDNSEIALLHNLTTIRFRSYWERTDTREGNERIRFQHVIRLLNQSSLYPSKRKPIGKQLRDNFADGKWHRLDEIVKQCDTHEAHVLSAIKTQELHGYITVEKKRVGSDRAGNRPTTAYRMFPTNKTVSLDELTTKLAPIIEGLEAEGKKNMATMSPATVATLAGRLKRLLAEWEK